MDDGVQCVIALPPIHNVPFIPQVLSEFLQGHILQGGWLGEAP